MTHSTRRTGVSPSQHVIAEALVGQNGDRQKTNSKAHPGNRRVIEKAVEGDFEGVLGFDERVIIKVFVDASALLDELIDVLLVFLDFFLGVFLVVFFLLVLLGLSLGIILCDFGTH